jgi:hypothetical protein
VLWATTGSARIASAALRNMLLFKLFMTLSSMPG